MTDKEIKWLSAPPREFVAATQMAVSLLSGSGITGPGLVREAAMNIHWHEHGTSYIVDELIGGPWDA